MTRRAATPNVVRLLDAAAADPDWRALLQLGPKGQPRGNLFNVMIAMRHADELRGALRWDEFRLSTEVVRQLPWSQETGRGWQNVDDVKLTEWLQAHDVNVSLDVAQQAVDAVAHEARFHPVRSWLDGLSWDGTERVGKWLSYYLGAEHNDYTSTVGRCWMISAIARIYHPGCKADHVIVLEGPQGKGKSTALRTLAGAEWFTDEMAELGSKDAAMQTRGVWIVELSELDQLTRGEVSRIKAFISRTVDRFRPPYGKRLIEAPRECVFAGTVNGDQYLKDDTGNRRFWPVTVSSIDADALAQDRAQLWAEAMTLFRAGATWWISGGDIGAAAADEQQRRTVLDPWFDRIGGYVAGQDKVTVPQILSGSLEKKPGDWNRNDEIRIGAILRQLGYERHRETAGKRGWYYARQGELVPSPSQAVPSEPWDG